MRFRVAVSAEQDLDEIFAYWADRAGPETADRIIDAIIERFALIGEFPQAGRACDDISPAVRCFPAGKYLIYYRKARRAVEIVHVFHGARKQARSISTVRREK